ncbi:MAG: ABC transporter ATP-binding protein [Candidatus Aureabacteria bacterium]|nr:ABC transporter ATP-binding protein [Candidatus Auribacterota bacterium]
MLSIRNLTLRMGQFSLKEISCDFHKRSYSVLLGPTGSGKSTLIKSVLGLYPPQQGRVFLNNQEITRTPPELRGIGYVPQDLALFPHLSVEGNIRFGLRFRNIPPPDADRAVDSLCRLLSIHDLRGRGVRNLSGGEKQKVALARALAPRPGIVLLDEPFSSIDEGARRVLWLELKQIAAELGITVVHITHNLEEAYTLGESISVLIDGTLVQSGSKQEIFERPATESVARYLNYRNIFTGRAEDHQNGSRIDCGHFKILVNKRISPRTQATVCVRQQDLKIVREEYPLRDSLKANVFSGEIVSLLSLPESCVMMFRIEGSPHRYDFELRFPAYIRERHALREGNKIRVAILTPNIIIF